MGVRFTHALSKIQLPLTVPLLILSPLVFLYQRDSSTLLDLKLCLSQELSSCLSTAFHSGTRERMKDEDEDVGLLRLNGICSSQASSWLCREQCPHAAGHGQANTFSLPLSPQTPGFKAAMLGYKLYKAWVCIHRTAFSPALSTRVELLIVRQLVFAQWMYKLIEWIDPPVPFRRTWGDRHF